MELGGRVFAACLALSVLGCGPRDDGLDKLVQDVEPRLDEALERHRSAPVELGADGLPPPIGLELGLQAPSFVEPPAPWTYPDRVWSVRGLHRAAEQLLAVDGAGELVLVRGRIRDAWLIGRWPKGEPHPPEYAWALLDDPQAGEDQLSLRLLQYDLATADRLWRDVPRIELPPGELFVISGRLVRLDSIMLPARFGLEVFAVTRDPPRSPDARWLHVRGSYEHPVVRAAVGLEPSTPIELSIPARFAHPSPRRSLEPLEPPTGVDDALERARAAAELDDLPRADYYLRRALLLAPERPELWIELAELHFESSRAAARDHALSIISKGLEHNRDAAVLYDAEAMLRLRSDDSSERQAVSAAARAVELMPHDVAFRDHLGIAQANLAMRREAIATLEQFLAMDDYATLPIWMIEDAHCVLRRLRGPLDAEVTDVRVLDHRCPVPSG